MLLSLLRYSVKTAFLHASAAADTGVHAVVVCRIVYQLVHESLTEPLLLGLTVIAVSHHREVGVHAGIQQRYLCTPFFPASKSLMS